MGSLPPMFSDFNIKKYKLIKYPSDISLQTLNEIKSLQTKRMDVAYSDKYDDINKSFKRLFNNRTREYPEELVNDLIEMSNSITSSLDKVENELYQTKNQSNQDPLNYGVKLTNNLGNLNSAFRASDFRPTDQDIKVKDELIKKVKIQLDEYNSIISNDIPNFNSSFKNLELDYLNVFM